QSLPRGRLDRSRRSVLRRLRRPAPCRPPGFHHAEHGSNGRQETRRAAHCFRSQKLGAGMTLLKVIARQVDRTPVLLEVTGLAKRYGEQRALADISFAVNAGEVLGVIGPNGAGKTKLLETIAGILPLDAGRVVWREASLSLEQRREV